MPEHPGKQHGSHLSRDPREGQRRRVTQSEALRHLQEAAEGGDELAKRMLLAFHKRGQPTLSVGTGNEPVPGLPGLVKTPDGRLIVAATGEEFTGDSGGLVNLAGGPALGVAKFTMSKLPTLARMLKAPQRFLSRFKKLSSAKQKETLTKLTGDTEKFRTGVRTTRATPEQIKDLNVADDILGKATQFAGKGRAGQAVSRGTAAAGTGLAVAGGAIGAAAKKTGQGVFRHKGKILTAVVGADLVASLAQRVFPEASIPQIADLIPGEPKAPRVKAEAEAAGARLEAERLQKRLGLQLRTGQFVGQAVTTLRDKATDQIEQTKLDLETQALSRVQSKLNNLIEATGGRITGEQALRATNVIQGPRMVQDFISEDPAVKTQVGLETEIVELMQSPEFKEAGRAPQ